MNHFEEELARILADDPLGLLDVKPKQSNAITADQRLVGSFEEINAFVRQHSREPAESRDIRERQLFSRLKSLRSSPERAAALKEYDEFNLLGDVKSAVPTAIESVDDILNDDARQMPGGVQLAAKIHPVGVAVKTYVVPAVHGTRIE